MICLFCNSEAFEEDHIRNEMICVSCGVICENFNMENDTEYAETKYGNVQVIGKLHYSGNISKHRTREKAKKVIDEICFKLHLPDVYAEKALQFFSLLLEKGKTKSNSRLMTAGVCIYLSARLNFEPIALLDVSDKINVSVYRLGKLYKKLKTILGIEIKSSDPSLFVNKVAEVFQFSENKKEIIETALKMLQIMENDAIISRGKPKIIATAIVIISAKLHEVNVEYDNIEKTVGIRPYAVDAFINQWKNSPVSGITLAEFQNIILIKNSDKEIIECVKCEIKTSTKLDSDSGEDIDLSGSDSDELEELYLVPKSQ